MTADMTRTYFQNMVDEFVREISIMQEFKGTQNIVSVEDFKVMEKEDQTGWNICIRMELLTPFITWLSDRVLSEEEIIRLGKDICTALELCADRNVIHRDIKPENIFVNQFGDFKLGDFGIARSIENLTSNLSSKGTYNYMAPEVANGESYDATADIYSLGLVMYKLANKNRFPFLNTEKQLLSPGERADALKRRLNKEPLPAPCNASEELADLILFACAPEARNRFSTATAMKHALTTLHQPAVKVQPAAEAQPTAASVTQADTPARMVTVTKAPEKKKKSKLPILIGAVAVIAVVAVLIIIISYNNVKDRKKRAKITEAISSAVLYEERGDYASAEAVLEDVDEEYPGDKQIAAELDKVAAAKLLQNAIESLDAGNYTEASGILDDLESTYKYDADTDTVAALREEIALMQSLDQAQSLLDAGDEDGAVQILNVLLESDPENGLVIEKLETIKEEQELRETITQISDSLATHDLETAQSLLNEALTDHADQAELQSLNKRLDVFLQIDAINAEIDAENYDNADSMLRSLETSEINLLGQLLGQSTGMDEETEALIQQTRERLTVSRAVSKANEACAEGDYESAIAALQETQETYPDNARLADKLMEIQFAQRCTQVAAVIDSGDYESAEDLLSELSADFPGRDGIQDLRDQLAKVKQYYEIRVCMDAEDYEQARTLLTQAEDAYPGDASFTALEGQLYGIQIVSQADPLIRDGQYDQAEELIRSALQEYPGELSLSREQEVLELCREPRYMMQYLVPWYSSGSYTPYVNGASFSILDSDGASIGEFTNGFVFNESWDSEAGFNLQGKYSSIEFDVVGEKDSRMDVYLEDEQVPVFSIQTTPGEVQHFQADLHGAQYIRFETTDFKYKVGVANIQLFSDFDTAKNAVFLPTLKTNQCYLVDRYYIEQHNGHCYVYGNDASFSMCGADYFNGFQLYSSSGFKRDAYVELDDEYSLLEFDVGYINTDFAGTLSVFLDEASIPSVHAQTTKHGYVKHYSVSLEGVKTIRFQIDDNYAGVGVANVVLTK